MLIAPRELNRDIELPRVSLVFLIDEDPLRLICVLPTSIFGIVDVGAEWEIAIAQCFPGATFSIIPIGYFSFSMFYIVR